MRPSNWFASSAACKQLACIHNLIFRRGTLILLLAAVSFGHIARAQSDDNANSDQKVKKVFYSAKDRLNAMHNATLFTPRAVSEAAILEGPPQSKKLFQLHFNDKVICDFDAPGSKMGGKTPKFSCKITRVESADGTVQTLTPEMDEEPVKVKFGADDNEVYAEIVATRLMWALGYPADAWFPVRVECHNCPENVISGSGSPATRTFDPATIVRIVRALGFGNFREFQKHLHDLSIAFATSADTMQTGEQGRDGRHAYVADSLERDLKNLQALKNTIDASRLSDLAKRFYSARRIVLLAGDLAAFLVDYLDRKAHV